MWSCSAGEALTGSPPHFSTSQIRKTNPGSTTRTSSGPGCWISIPNSSSNSRASALIGDSPSSTCPPGKSHTSGYHRRPAERWHNNTRPSRTKSAATISWASAVPGATASISKLCHPNHAVPLHARVTFANAGPCGGLMRHAGRSCARSSRDLRLDGGPEPPSPLITGAGGGSFAAKDVHPAADPSNCPGPRITLPAFGLRLNASDHAGFVVYGMYSQRMMPARSYQRRTLRGKGDRRRQ